MFTSTASCAQAVPYVTRLFASLFISAMQIAAALGKINAAQASLKVESAFKGDKSAFVSELEQAFRGHNIRKDTYQALADKYADFSAMYKAFDVAASFAKGKADTFKEIFLENLHDLLDARQKTSSPLLGCAGHKRPVQLTDDGRAHGPRPHLTRTISQCSRSRICARARSKTSRYEEDTWSRKAS